MDQSRVSATPTQLVPLGDVIARAPEDQEPAPGFVARLHGENVEVTAVLQRTAVVAPLRDRWADKRVVPLTNLLVDPAAITWRPNEVLAWRRRRNTVGQREAKRLASDRRARADQARQEAAEAAARETAAQRRTASAAPPDGGRAMPRPQTAAASQRSITVSVAATPVPAATKTLTATYSVAAELCRARLRIAELEAELQRHRAVALHLVRRVEVIVGRTAA